MLHGDMRGSDQDWIGLWRLDLHSDMGWLALALNWKPAGGDNLLSNLSTAQYPLQTEPHREKRPGWEGR